MGLVIGPSILHPALLESARAVGEEGDRTRRRWEEGAARSQVSLCTVLP